jgi:transcriptional regulator with XRE-family HTH domain
LTVASRGDVLREAMRESGTSQSELARLSGVRQPSISQVLSGRIEMSDEQVDRLLSCMGYRLETVRRPVRVEMTRSERRSWQLHCQLARVLDEERLDEWRPTIRANLRRIRAGVRGQPHERNVQRWSHLVRTGDLGGLHRVLTGLDRDSIEMREVAPTSGLLSEQERLEVLSRIG